MQLLNSSMRPLQDFQNTRGRFQSYVSGIAVSHDFIYSTEIYPARITCYEIANDFAMAREESFDEVHGTFCPTLGPNGILYVIAFPGDHEYDEEGQEDEVLALDANTLALRFTFGRGRFEKEAFGMALVGNELYICDRQAWALQSFSLAGEHLREIRGDWRQPESLCYFNGRLFLNEHDGDDELPGDVHAEDEVKAGWPQAKKEAGKRIFVLTPQGETLQVWKAPEGVAYLKSMAIFQQELVVSMGARFSDCDQMLSLAGI